MEAGKSGKKNRHLVPILAIAAFTSAKVLVTDDPSKQPDTDHPVATKVDAKSIPPEPEIGG
jgi:hypothetical protein